jgi:hypothetical protein
LISEFFFAYGADIRDFFLLKDEFFCLFQMAVAAEHAFDTPFFARLVLVTAKFFSAYSAMNDLLFSKDVQAKSVHALTHTKMYILLPLQRYESERYRLIDRIFIK